jgi:hypothetical protein
MIGRRKSNRDHRLRAESKGVAFSMITEPQGVLK